MPPCPLHHGAIAARIHARKSIEPDRFRLSTPAPPALMLATDLDGTFLAGSPPTAAAYRLIDRHRTSA